jgi:hypothetical protein
VAQRKIHAMTALVFLLIFLALMIYALWHNHTTGRFAGSVDIDDRDRSRLEADLRAISARWRN